MSAVRAVSALPPILLLVVSLAAGSPPEGLPRRIPMPAGAVFASRRVDASPDGTETNGWLQESLYLDLKGYHGFSVREFNRVDGFVPSFRIALRGVEEGRFPSLGLTALYAVARRRPLWEFSIEKSLLEAAATAIRFEAFRLTETHDAWRIADLENSIAGFLLREDFRDYYETQGIRIGIRLEPGFFHQIRIEYADRAIRPLAARTPFTLFGWDKAFRQNPAVDAGTDRSLTIRWRYDSRDNIRFPRRGWFNELQLEAAPTRFAGDFAYRILTAHLRRYNIITGRHALNFRVSFARSSGTLPPHRRFSLGGIGTLRGVRDLSERGSNFLLGNVEYRLPVRGPDWKPFRMVFSELQALAFMDAGEAWCDRWRARDLRLDIGAGISGTNIFSYFGLYIARAIDDEAKGVRVTARMQRDF